MKMFFKKKKKNEEFTAPATGVVKAITEVKDPVFSQKMMGDGYAVTPETSDIYAPVAGTISSVFPTKHALGITTKTGLEVLVHIGIDTVELQGEPFEVFVSEGDKVTPATKIATVDLAKLAEKGKDSDIMVILTNMDAVKSITQKITGATNYGTVVADVEVN